MKMEFIKQNIGIDIAKDDFKVSFSMMATNFDIVVKRSKTIKNSRQGYEELIALTSTWRVKDLDLHFTMEATGVYYENPAYFLHDQEHSVHVVLPNQSKKYGQSLGVESKTDKIDAKILACMGMERKLRNWEPLSSNFQTLKRFARERDALNVERTMTLNRLHAYQHEGCPNSATIRRSHELIAFGYTKVNIKKIMANKFGF